MDSFIYSIIATVPIFLVMIVGWGIKQLGVIDEHEEAVDVQMKTQIPVFTEVK